LIITEDQKESIKSQLEEMFADIEEIFTNNKKDSKPVEDKNQDVLDAIDTVVGLINLVDKKVVRKVFGEILKLMIKLI